MRLNLGAGEWQPEGYTTLDLHHADIRHDLRVLPWPVPGGACEAILASHILEHLTREDGRRFLDECRRILRPGGTLDIAVPDMDRFIGCHLADDFTPLAGYPWRSLDTLMGGDASERQLAQRHRYMYCWASLAWTLERTGFIAERVGFQPPHNPRYEAISLYVRATL